VTVRVLQSFPHKIGAARICTTAWHQAVDVAAAGGDVTLLTGVIHRPLPRNVRVQTTLAKGRYRIPYSLVGQLRALALHDLIVARKLSGLECRIDVVHAWPLAAVHTLRAARRLGIPTVLERPNAHTRFAMEVVAEECDRLDVRLPPNHEHAYNAAKLHKEEEEYSLADYLLCPSDFVVDTFRHRGFETEKLLRHSYGYDDTRFRPLAEPHDQREGLAALFVGVAAVRKGLHFALEAWLRSPASAHGTLTIAGEILPDYRRKLAPMLAHQSVRALGHRNDVPELMARSDILVLPSIEEGAPLACMEAVGSGCVPVVSAACAGIAVDGNALVHPVGDVDTLTRHLTLLHEDRNRLAEMRAACLRLAPQFTWEKAGTRLLDIYEAVAA